MDQLPELKKRREEIKKEIDDLSFEKEKNKNKIDELFKVLKELDSQIAGFEEKSEKQKERVTSSTGVFRSLQSVLNRSSEFYPNNELFDEDLVYFPEKEQKAMREMQVCLTGGTEERMFLLYGHPASGKTVMGIAVGKALEKKGYETLYHRITGDSDINELWTAILGNSEKDVLFILDDCHLNTSCQSSRVSPGMSSIQAR
jgi:DNA replication protein DnaC